MTTEERHPLPADFFVGSGLSESWALVFTQVLTRLREENSADNTLDLMLLERTSYVYTALRQKEQESDGNIVLTGPYKDMSKLLVSMLEMLRAQRDKDFIIEEARREVIHALRGALTESLAPLPASERQLVMSRLSMLMGE